ncbi:MAG: O-antigen ligase family protein [Acidobacteriota bacterium]
MTLAALAVLPARDGSTALTLYREPKAVVFTALVWIWLAALFVGPVGRATLAALPRVATARRLLPWLLWVGFMASSAAWTTVPDNAFYELRTLLPAALWMVVLIAWQEADPRAPIAMRRALIVASTAVCVLGLAQLVRPISWLPPIHPELGGPHASTFGFKNPAALAVLGQWFLLAHWALTEARPTYKIGAVLLCLGEALYIASLHSRTALLALVVGLVVLGLATLWRGGVAASRSLAIAAFGGLIGLVVVVALVAPWRERAMLGVEILRQPTSYLDSDRGIYLRNTLAMVERHPFGVGLGDWQTHYPVFRRHARDHAFDRLVEVRRAHSDHVQILGEAGWPGLASWCAALAATIVGGLRRWRATGDHATLFVHVQLIAWTVAMTTDYVIEMPFHRFQFFLVVALALGRPVDGGRVDSEAQPPPLAGRFLTTALAGLLAIVSITEVWRGTLLLSRLRAASFMVACYQRGLADNDPAALGRALRFGEELARRPGYTKTTARDERILAHLYWLHGATPRARAWLRRSLEHHPYAPAGLDLASRMLDSSHPEAASAFARARDHVVSEAQDGFALPYPTWPDGRGAP